MDSRRLIQRCTKPDAKEFKKIAVACAIGFSIMGFIGYTVKMLGQQFSPYACRPLCMQKGPSLMNQDEVHRDTAIELTRSAARVSKPHSVQLRLVFIPINNIIVGGS